MQITIHTALAISMLITSGCEPAPDPDATPEWDYTVEVTGAFDRLDPDDPRSLWSGIELVQISDSEGSLVCEDGWELEAAEVDQTYAGEVTLDTLRGVFEELDDYCELVHEDTPIVIERDRYLAFALGREGIGLDFGTVRTADSLDGEWVDYAQGVRFSDDSLFYRRTTGVDIP